MKLRWHDELGKGSGKEAVDIKGNTYQSQDWAIKRKISKKCKYMYGLKTMMYMCVHEYLYQTNVCGIFHCQNKYLQINLKNTKISIQFIKKIWQFEVSHNKTYKIILNIYCTTVTPIVLVTRPFDATIIFNS